MNSHSNSLHQGFLDAAEDNPNNIAIEAPSGVLTYRALGAWVRSIAAALQLDRSAAGPSLTAVLADRDLDAFAGILGTLVSGHGYVPLNPTFPVERTIKMLNRSTCETLIVGRAEQEVAAKVVAGCPAINRVVLPGTSDSKSLLDALPKNRSISVVTQDDLPAPDQWIKPSIDPQQIAYLLFTSGSTGEPKGVMVSHNNIRQFIKVMQARYKLIPADRVSQMFDLVFDLSLFDQFMSWEAGATLCVPDKDERKFPTNYIRDKKLTVWFSVPSVVVLMYRLRQLERNVFPSLRINLFCGEALPADATMAWADAAPQGLLENLYGPTELTLACLLYPWLGPESEAACKNGVVPIGYPYPEMEVVIADDDLKPVEYGEPGELLMAGPQVALGYWEDEQRTSVAFTQIPGRSEVFYRTGDLVSQQSAKDPIVYLGRLDQQIKINGHRVELGDIEATLKNASGGYPAVVVPRTDENGVIRSLFAFLEAENLDALPNLKQEIELTLPKYMVPAEIRAVDRFPLNSNGKVDRNALKQLLH